MTVGLAAIATFLFYFNAIPVKLALLLRVTGTTSVGTGVAIFEGRFALRMAGRKAASKSLYKKEHKAALAPKIKLLPSLAKALFYLLRHLKLEQLEAHGKISLSKASQTALICGCTHMLEGALSPFVPANAVHLDLTPDFSSGHSDFTLQCMISLRTGHIILAALLGVWHYAYRRISHGKASH